jgi:hypothetical protein
MTMSVQHARGLMLPATGQGFGEPLPPLASYPGPALIIGATLFLRRSSDAGS